MITCLRSIALVMALVISSVALIACEIPAEQPPSATCTEAAARCSLGQGKLGVCTPTGPDQQLRCTSQH